MLIGGLQKTTLIDFPGRIACTVFTVGCNFRCPFCHNKDLVTFDNFKKAKLKNLAEKEFFAFLKKRQGILDGVCITGGEPTIQKDLEDFIKEIKTLGFEVKLDTNGSNPNILVKLIKKNLLDFIAMDIKTDLESYKKAIGLKTSIENIKKTIKLILKSGLEYEFRTTVVPGIHTKKSLIKLAKQLAKFAGNTRRVKDSPVPVLHRDPGVAGGINWVLQQFQPKNCLEPKFLKVRPYSNKEMKDMLKSVQSILPKTRLRGGEFV